MPDDTALDLVALAGGPMLTPAQRKRLQKVTKKNGYAKPPGSGPAGHKCGDCAHLTRNHAQSGRYFLKCGLMKAHWTHGGGTDIRSSAPACSLWQADDPGRPVPPHGSGP